MWVLAARQIVRTVKIQDTERVPVIGQAILTGIILSYISLTAVAIINNPTASDQEVLIRLIGALLLLIASTGLVAWGWSRLVAMRGFVLGLFAVLMVYTLSAGWDAAGHSGQAGREILSGSLSLSGATRLVQTIDDLNRWGPKETNGLDIAVVESRSPALRWLLRGYQRVTFVDQLSASASPALVLTPDQPELALAATYRGQGFVLSNAPLWGALQPMEWLRWFVFRSVPGNAMVQDRLILWARLDVFPVSTSEEGLSSGAQPPPTNDSGGGIDGAQ
jgi:hypothetical protein